MNGEWSIPDSSIPLMQGDLLISRDPSSGIIHEMCVVITADCDIDKNKYGKHLACLKLNSLETYIRSVWAEKKIKKELLKLNKEIVERLCKWQTLDTGIPSMLTADGINAWTIRCSPAEICQALHIPEKHFEKTENAIAKYTDAKNAFANNSIKDELVRLVKIRSILNKKSFKECWTETVKQAEKEIKEKKPVDVFFLPTLPEPIDMPAVILLRDLVGVQRDTVFFTSSEANSINSYLRVGRLNSVYKYAMSQSFGTLFSRIGLPKEYENRCEEVTCKISGISWE